jgi:hypothetical protein
MRKIAIATILCFSVLTVETVHADGLEPAYAAVESVTGCGATGQPVWTSTTTEYSVGNGIYWPVLERHDVDSIRVVVTCVGCSLYSNTIDNWWFYDVGDSVWDSSIDLGGYHSSSGSNYYYRGEEKNELCSQDYGIAPVSFMKFKWGYTSPGTQEQWVFKYPVKVI